MWEPNVATNLGMAECHMDRKRQQSEHLQVGIVRRRRIVTIVRGTRAIVIVRLAIAAPTTQNRLLRTAI